MDAQLAPSTLNVGEKRLDAAPALAIGVGYVLGRSDKLRWVAPLRTAAATARLSGRSTQAAFRKVDSAPGSAHIRIGLARSCDPNRDQASIDWAH